MRIKETLKELYERDYHRWLEETIELLKAGEYSELDVDSLIEELEYMKKSLYNKLVGSLAVILAHIYKLQHFRQFSQGGHSWVKSIERERQRLEKLLKDNPSLKRYLEEALKEAWEDAVADIIIDLKPDLKLTRRDFPQACPYSWHDILEKDWWEEVL